MANETYRLTDFHKHAANYMMNRFYGVRDKLRQKILDDRATTFFKKSDEYRQMMDMKKAAPDMWSKLSLHADPMLSFINDIPCQDSPFTDKNSIEVPENKDYIDYKEPDNWTHELTSLHLPIFDGITTAWASANTPGYWKASDVLNSEGGWEEWKDAKQYSLWGREVKELTSIYLQGFVNLNQVYWSFPELVEALSGMKTVRQRQSIDPTETWRSGPAIDVTEAYESCRSVHNKKRRPNIVKTPPKELKKLVATLKLVG